MKPGRHGEDVLRIGVGAGMADDRVWPGIQMMQRGEIDYLLCECLAERTIARETLNRRKHPDKGYNPMLEERVRAFFPMCREQGVRMVTNMGAANPVGAAHALRAFAADEGVDDVSCAVVLGDNVTDTILKHPELPLLDGGAPLEELLPRIASANAYLGADLVSRALDTGAEAVITGRVADPSLFLGVMMHHHGWSYDDYEKLAIGTVAGHLLECSVQVTGGYFADPGKKDVPDLANLPYPLADIRRDGAVTIGKPAGTGGLVNRMTCTEQIMYEIHDPRRYITPDCVVDLTELDFTDYGNDRVGVTGAIGRPRTDSFKTVIGYHDGYIGVGEVAYAGINAEARARLAAETVLQRFRAEGGVCTEMQVDLIGISALHGDPGGEARPHPYEVRLRVAGRCPDKRSADLLGDHVRQMNMQGPAAAGGPINFGAKEIIAVNSVLIPRAWVRPEILIINDDSRAAKPRPVPAGAL